MFESYDEAIREFTQQYLARLFTFTRGNVSQAAKLAGRSRTEFYRFLKRVDFDHKPYAAWTPGTDYVDIELEV